METPESVLILEVCGDRQGKAPAEQDKIIATFRKSRSLNTQHWS